MKLTFLPLITVVAFYAISQGSYTLAGENQIISIESLTVTGTRLRGQSQISSTIDRAQIERINPLNTVDLLRQIPNLLISTDGIAGRSHLAIRGGESNFTLVMIDGVPVNDPSNSSGGGFDFSQIDPAVIERIDVYQGGTSAIYGGEAVSGVIHFVTREAGSNSVAVEAGNGQQRRGNLTLSLPTGQQGANALISLSTNQQRASSFAELQHKQALLKIGVDARNSDHRLLLSASTTDRVAFAEDSGGDLFALPRESESRDSKHSLASWRSRIAIVDNQDLITRVSWTRIEERTDNPGIASGVIDGIPPSLVDSDYRKLDTEVYLNWALSQIQSLVGGISGYKAVGENRGTLDFGFPIPVGFTQRQESYSAFIESSTRLNELTLDLGLRFDAPQQFSDELSSRVNLTWQPGPQYRLHGSYSEGYKLPSFFALAHPLVGNPELKPELSKNAELGVRLQPQAGVGVQLNLFRNSFKDLVTFDAEKFTNVNADRVHTSGAEVGGSWQLTEWLDARMDITYLDTDIKGSDSHLRRRPNWFGGIQLDARFDDLLVTVSADSRGKFYDSSIPTGEVLLSGYSDVALAIQWQLSDDLSLTFNLDNVLDRDFQQSVGFVDPGLQVRAGFRLEL